MDDAIDNTFATEDYVVHMLCCDGGNEGKCNYIRVNHSEGGNDGDDGGGDESDDDHDADGNDMEEEDEDEDDDDAGNANDRNYRLGRGTGVGKRKVKGSKGKRGTVGANKRRKV